VQTFAKNGVKKEPKRKLKKTQFLKQHTGLDPFGDLGLSKRSKTFLLGDVQMVLESLAGRREDRGGGKGGGGGFHLSTSL